MKTKFFSLVLLGVCFGLAALSYYSPEETAGASEQPVLPSNEDLVYKITWLGIPVGTGELRLEKDTLNGRRVYHATGMIETNKVLRTVFPVHDKAESWIDAETLESLQFEKTVDELLINAHEKMVFDGPAGKGYFESLKTGEKQEFKILQPVLDVISVTYWVRRQKLIPGQSVKTALTADRKIWQLEARVTGMEKIKRDGNRINTIRVEPDTQVEGEEKKGKARFYLTADSSRTPLKIIYKAPFGKVTGTLVSGPSFLSAHPGESLENRP